eukprot:1455633-Pleurochrysis_carterae.AAC.2
MIQFHIVIDAEVGARGNTAMNASAGSCMGTLENPQPRARPLAHEANTRAYAATSRQSAREYVAKPSPTGPVSTL